jgi:muramoyltetrapeptide carboxypeptidase
MSKRIGIVGVSSDVEPRTREIAERLYGAKAPELAFAPFHEPCGHFAATDEQRAHDFLTLANREDIDAVWFCRGGYGSGRLIEPILKGLKPAARNKDYLGYSDAGSLLGALYNKGFPRLAHGPMPHDALIYEKSGASVERALRWLVDKDPAVLEAGIDGAAPTAAFNIVILSNLVGTPFLPDLTGHVLMLEEVWEEMYRIDRSLFQLTSNPMIRNVKEIRLGCWKLKENMPAFDMTDEEVIRYWCERSGIPYGGRAEVGHYEANRVVPFGRYPA